MISKAERTVRVENCSRGACERARICTSFFDLFDANVPVADAMNIASAALL